MTRAGQLKFTPRKTLKRGRNIGVQKRLSFVFICGDIYICIYIYIYTNSLNVDQTSEDINLFNATVLFYMVKR